MTDAVVDVEGKEVRLSNLEKTLYPEAGWTKAHVIDYYRRIAPFLLPHLRDRPLTLRRYPDGVQSPGFFEKDRPAGAPEWVRTVDWPGERRTVRHVLANDLPTLVWLSNLAALELHTTMSRAEDLALARAVVFDLDPGAPADIVQCCEVALRLREMLDALQLEAFPKTSGSKGLQVYVPLNTKADFDETKGFARAVATLLEREAPERIVSEMAKAKRRGRVFIDWSQNDDHKTTVCAYSLRARPRPTVSTPVTWDEVERTARAKDASRLVFEAEDVLARVEADGDLFAPVLKKRQRLPRL